MFDRTFHTEMLRQSRFSAWAGRSWTVRVCVLHIASWWREKHREQMTLEKHTSCHRKLGAVRWCWQLSGGSGDTWRQQERWALLSAAACISPPPSAARAEAEGCMETIQKPLWPRLAIAVLCSVAAFPSQESSSPRSRLRGCCSAWPSPVPCRALSALCTAPWLVWQSC